ncbi:SDR family NAD(P)-dependent oxidoreductase, partial [Staphylococcus aureus]
GEIERLIPECVARFGPLDALINNASTFRNDGIETITWESYDYHLEPGLAAPVFLSRDFARAFGGRRGGVIVHMLDQKVGNLNPDFLS